MDTYAPDGSPLGTEKLLTEGLGDYTRLNHKRATPAGRVRTSLDLPTILLARKSLIDEAVARRGLPRWLALPSKLLVVAALWAAALRTGGRGRDARGDASEAQ